MTLHTCPRCGYSTNQKQSMRTHYQRKIPCNPVLQSIGLDELLDKLENPDNAKYTCTKCSKKYTSRQGLVTHQKKMHSSDITKSLEGSNVQTIKLDNENKQTVCMTCECMRIRYQELLQELSLVKRENQRLRNENLKYKTKRTEEFYQVVVENWLQSSHVQLGIGVSDVTTEDTHVEIKDWKSWKHAAGQLRAYHNDSPKENLFLCLYGPYDKVAKQKAIANVKKDGVRCFDFVDVDRKVIVVDSDTQEEVYSLDLETL